MISWIKNNNNNNNKKTSLDQIWITGKLWWKPLCNIIKLINSDVQMQFTSGYKYIMDIKAYMCKSCQFKPKEQKKGFCSLGLTWQFFSLLIFFFFVYWPMCSSIAHILFRFLSFFYFPVGHSVSYLEYMTHMAGAIGKKRRGEQFLYEWYLKITKFEHDLRLEYNRERGSWGRGGFSVGTFGLGSLTEMYCGGNDDPLWAPLLEELQMLNHLYYYRSARYQKKYFI